VYPIAKSQWALDRFFFVCFEASIWMTTIDICIFAELEALEAELEFEDGDMAYLEEKGPELPDAPVAVTADADSQPQGQNVAA
jgi:hypothetical protein